MPEVPEVEHIRVPGVEREPASGRSPDDPAMLGEFPIPGLVRRARRIGDLSQRQMARIARVAPATVGRVETGEMVPSLSVLSRLLGAAGLYLVAVDQDGRVIIPMKDCDEVRDGARRRYPAHLDTIIDPEPGEWWADVYGLARPPETFYRSRDARDTQRKRSQWEVRVKQHRHEPPPFDPSSGGY